MVKDEIRNTKVEQLKMSEKKKYFKIIHNKN